MTNKTRSIIFCSIMGILLLTSVLGWVWTDTAKTPFWWTFWEITAIGSAAGFIGGIIWFAQSRKKW